MYPRSSAEGDAVCRRRGRVRRVATACSSLLVLVLAWPSVARADEIRVAVAANFLTAVRALGAEFAKRGGDRVLVSFGSTGKLAAQIRHGAPYDVFLAADAARPRLLEREHLTVAGSRFTYAIGRLVLWSARAGYVDDKGEVLRTDRFARLAIANPATAPYGAAARQVLAHLGLWDRVQPRLVRGENIGQTYQFVASGNAPLGFVALSQVTGAPGKGSRWLVPQALYAPIEQQAALLSRSAQKTAARRFLAFLRSAAGRAVIERFGYGLP